MVLVYLPSNALSTILLGFLLPWTWVSFHSCSSKAQLLLLTLDEGCLLTATPPDLESGVVPLGPLVPMQPPLLGCGLLLSAATPDLKSGGAPLCHSCAVQPGVLVTTPELGQEVALNSHASSRSITASTPDGQHRNQIDHILCSQRWRSYIQSAKTRPRTDFCSDNGTLLPDSDLNWRK